MVCYIIAGNHNHHGAAEEDYANGEGSQRFMTSRQFCAYMLHERDNRPNDSIFQSRNLMQEFMVDNWAAVEQSRLNWITHNQKTIRGDTLQGLMDMHPNETLENIGQRVVLPSSFTNGP